MLCMIARFSALQMGEGLVQGDRYRVEVEADQSDDVFWYESPDLATRLTLIHEEGRTARPPRVLTDERG